MRREEKKLSGSRVKRLAMMKKPERKARRQNPDG
jgi:hypothetical protein